MNDAETLKQHFDSLNLPQDAAGWLLKLWQVTQFFDDVLDDAVFDRAEFNAALWNVLVAMPMNAFYLKHSLILSPIVASAILKWQASDNAERAGSADEKSFVWRASFYDVVLMVCLLVHGHEWAAQNADKVLSLYGESYNDYKTEF